MDIPSLIPSELREVDKFSSDKELFDFLVKRTDQLVNFFNTSLEDEAWTNRHREFFSLTLNWFTQRYLENKLDDVFAKEIAKGLQVHSNILNSQIPRTIQLIAEEETFHVNPLLLGVSSPYFRSLIQRGGFENKKCLVLPDVSSELCSYILKYIETGASENLWRLNQKEIKPLLMLSDKWGINTLSKEAETVLSRYIDRANLIERLLDAVKTNHKIISAKCVSIFNEHETGARIFAFEEGIGFEFLNFFDATFQIFEKLKQVITHLIVSGQLTHEEPFEKALTQSPKLISLDISGSTEESPYLSSIPKRVRELNIARCAWLRDDILRRILPLVSQISVLNLAQNMQLTYVGWDAIKVLHNLQNIDLSHCHQIGEPELKVILQSAPNLIELSLYNCKKMTDQAFSNLGRLAARLRNINLSRTALTDGVLLEIGTRCRELQMLEIDHCQSVSERGLRAFLQAAWQLQSLSFKDNLIGEIGMNQLSKEFPKVQIQG